MFTGLFSRCEARVSVTSSYHMYLLLDCLNRMLSSDKIICFYGDGLEQNIFRWDMTGEVLCYILSRLRRLVCDLNQGYKLDFYIFWIIWNHHKAKVLWVFAIGVWVCFFKLLLKRAHSQVPRYGTVLVHTNMNIRHEKLVFHMQVDWKCKFSLWQYVANTEKQKYPG